MTSGAIDDELINRVTWKIPNALALVGSRAGDEWNAMTTSWITQLSMEPVLIGVGVDNHAVTHRLISDGRIVHREPVVGRRHEGVREVLEAGVVRRHDPERPADPRRHYRSAGVRRGDRLGRLRTAAGARLGSHTLFIGEVVDAGVRDDDAWPASMSDTRMKYGGIKRH